MTNKQKEAIGLVNSIMNLVYSSMTSSDVCDCEKPKTLKKLKVFKLVYDFKAKTKLRKKLRSLLQEANEGKLIEEIEFLRQGFRSAIDNSRDKVFRFSMDAYHKNADRLVVELGGESVRHEQQEEPKERPIKSQNVNCDYCGESFHPKEGHQCTPKCVHCGSSNLEDDGVWCRDCGQPFFGELKDLTKKVGG